MSGLLAKGNEAFRVNLPAFESPGTQVPPDHSYLVAFLEALWGSGGRSVSAGHSPKWRQHEVANVSTTRRFAEYGDVRGISAKFADITLHPLELGDLVKNSIIPGRMM